MMQFQLTSRKYHEFLHGKFVSSMTSTIDYIKCLKEPMQKLENQKL